MECSRYLEEKAGQSENPEFLRHLATCGACQRDVEEMDEIRSLYRSASVERYPGGVPSVRRAGLGSWVSAVAAAAMIAVLVFMMVPRTAPVENQSARASVPYFRVHVEPWRNDARFDHALDDCWKQLDTLERSK